MKRPMFLISTKGKTEEEIVKEVMEAQKRFLAALEKARAEESGKAEEKDESSEKQ